MSQLERSRNDLAASRNRRRIGLVALLAALLVAAAPPPAAPDPSADRIRADVEFLADDLLEGRDTGSRGHAIAAGFVASRFRALGLTPGGDKKGWYQQVPMRRATHSGEPAIALIEGGRRVPLRHGVDIALRPGLAERKLTIDSALVFVGYGLADPRLGLDDYRGLDVRGKTVVLLSGTPTGLPSEIAAHLQSQKRHFAVARGALGLIEFPADPAAERRQPEPLASYARRPALDWIAAGKPGRAPAGFELRISAAAAAGLFAGSRTSLEMLRRSLRDPAARPAGFALASRLALSATSLWEEFSSPEVIGILPGSDPALRGEYVVLMAHLDHLGVNPAARPGEDRIYNGALDNAAGVATMLDAARRFVDSGVAPRRSLMFIANTGEERGLVGADYFATFPTVPIHKIVGLVDLDMPLLLYKFTDVVAFGADHSTIARSVAAAGRAMGIAVSPDPMPEQTIFVRSDHYRFVLRGVPAILLMTGHANGGKPVWDKFLGSTYHSVRDDLSQPIDWLAAARYGELNYRIARILADQPQRPLWYRGDYFGDAYAPGQARAQR